MKRRTKSILCGIVYLIAFGAILLPTKYDLDQWQLWSLLIGGIGLYSVGRYEGLNNL